MAMETKESREAYTLRMEEGWKIVFDPERNIFVVNRDSREIQLPADSPLPQVTNQRTLVLKNKDNATLTVPEDVADALILNLGIKSATKRTCFEEKLTNPDSTRSKARRDKLHPRSKLSLIKIGARQRPVTRCTSGAGSSSVLIRCGSRTKIVQESSIKRPDESSSESEPELEIKQVPWQYPSTCSPPEECS
jgi:hypothetical protein